MPTHRSDSGTDNVRAVRALAHPLRLRLLDELRFGGPATATLLAHRVGESSGATSYHLRQLARHGYVEEAEPRGGRERWWRYRERQVVVPQGGDPGDSRTLLAELLSREAHALDRYLPARRGRPSGTTPRSSSRGRCGSRPPSCTSCATASRHCSPRCGARTLTTHPPRRPPSAFSPSASRYPWRNDDPAG